MQVACRKRWSPNGRSGRERTYQEIQLWFMHNAVWKCQLGLNSPTAECRDWVPGPEMKHWRMPSFLKQKDLASFIFKERWSVSVVPAWHESESLKYQNFPLTGIIVTAGWWALRECYQTVNRVLDAANVMAAQGFKVQFVAKFMVFTRYLLTCL